jgi:aminoglycoside phosphotransferase (APT) family kinase protein
MEAVARMHADEADIDLALAQRLVRDQFPEFAELELAAVHSTGTANALFRLGSKLVVRMPRIASAAVEVEKEQRWLPQLAAHLPLEIPTPVALGSPGHGYAWQWSIYRWLEGDSASSAVVENPIRAAVDLARFISALERLDPAGGPQPGDGNFWRGAPLRTRDNSVRAAVDSLGTEVDPDGVLAVWDAALEAPVWASSGVWIHGDLQPSNLLVRAGVLSAVIDFGGLGVGDPACDLMIAWTLLHGDARAAFRRELDVDDASWARGRGWALSVALIALPYYATTNPAVAELSRRTILETTASDE